MSNGSTIKEAKKMKPGNTRALLGVLIFSLAAASLHAGDEEELFGIFSEGGLITESEESEQLLDEDLLSNKDGVETGGSYGFTTTGSWFWNTDTDPAPENISEQLDYSLEARLFFSARPDTNIRVYGESWISSPFVTADDIVHLDELFADFTVGDSLFLRAGKQTMKWGVGYFFSPADLLSLSEIDPEDPEADLEGPVGLKANMAAGTNNLYLYGIIPEEASVPSDIALASKFELIAGAAEIGFGGYYLHDRNAAGMVTMTGALWDLDLFAEAVVQYDFIQDPWPEATIGQRYSWDHAESELAFSLTGQLYYTGADGAFHAAALGNLSFTDTISSSLFWKGSLEENSGSLKPSVTWKAHDYVRLDLSFPFNYGDVTMMGVSLECSLGGTKF
jgi:hypothetical protein